jgi:serine/threonine protein kinase
VIHGDLKPENVMIGAFGEVLVMDWGVARSIDEDGGGVIAGTKGFMSPEQERGEKLDARSDVYALGRVLQSLTEAERNPRRLASMIRKATSGDRNARYRDAAELRDDVSRFLDGEPVSAHRETMLEKTARWLQRNQALVTIVLAYLVMRVIVYLLVRN